MSWSNTDIFFYFSFSTFSLRFFFSLRVSVFPSIPFHSTPLLSFFYPFLSSPLLSFLLPFLFAPCFPFSRVSLQPFSGVERDSSVLASKRNSSVSCDHQLTATRSKFKEFSLSMSAVSLDRVSRALSRVIVVSTCRFFLQFNHVFLLCACRGGVSLTCWLELYPNALDLS